MPNLVIELKPVKIKSKRKYERGPFVDCPKHNHSVSLYDKCLSTANPCRYCGKLDFQVLRCAYGEGK